jgi:hypothetical protein
VNQTVIKGGIETTASYTRASALFRFISDITIEITVFWDTALCGFVNSRGYNTHIDGLA